MLTKALWEQCALPATLYVTEAMSITDGIINKLEEISVILGQYILQGPRSMASAAIWMDARMLPIRNRIVQKRLVFYRAHLNKPKKNFQF